MPVGDTQAQSYVTEELIRRALGRHSFRQSSDVISLDGNQVKSKLVNWWHTKTPFIRMVSNAVPNEEPTLNTLEWAEAERVFGEKPTEETRFRHIMFGGTGMFTPGTPKAAGETAEGSLGMRHNFHDIYSHPFTPGQSADKESEPGRFHRPMPGITSIDVNYSGNKGALRKAQINFKCYTLEDLERLEKLYMQPGIKVLLEWGWSSNTNGPDFSSNPIDLIPLDDAVLQDVSDVYIKISENRLTTGGCYDGMFGTITNFNWSINDDLSFNCVTKITDIGDSIFTSTVNTPVVNRVTVDDDDSKLTLTKALTEIKKEVEVGRGSRNKVRVETVAFKDSIGSFDLTTFRTAHGSTSKLGSDSHKTKRRHRCYVRFGDIVDILLNRLFIITSDATRASSTGLKSAHAMFAIGGNMTGGELTNVSIGGSDKKVTELPISVISNHKHLLSTDPDVCLLPGQIGAGEYDVAAAAETAKFDKDDLPSGIDSDSTVSFNLTQAQFDKMHEVEEGSGDRGGWAEGDFEAGLLCNIFVNIDLMEDLSASSQDVGGFLRSVTNSINQACGDVWAFNWTMTDEHPGIMTCLDRNFAWSGKTKAIELAVANNSGIVRSLSMKSSINQNTAKALFIAGNSQIKGEKQASTIANRAIIPIDVDFALDGLSGIQMGTSFAIDYLPAKYRAQTYLFAFTVNHSIDAGDWTTNITCKMRFATSKDGLDLIQLSALPTVKLSSDDVKGLVDMITFEAPAVGEGLDVEQQNSVGTGLFPRGIFHSLESKNLTIGAAGGDVTEGVSAEETDEKVETFDELKAKLEKIMAKIYHKGTSQDSDNTADAYSILQKIIYLPEEE